MKGVKTILIIDDDMDDLEIFREAVQRVNKGIQCYCLGSGEAFFIKLDTEVQFSPDLIFLDLNMPRLDGKYVLRRIKQYERLKPVPVIIYTTSDSDSDKEETKKLGASGFITKPSDFNELCEVLSEILLSPEPNHT